MSENMRKIIFILCLTYSLSVALGFSGIALMGGISIVKIMIFWGFFGSGIMILKTKVFRKYIPLFTFPGKKEVQHET